MMNKETISADQNASTLSTALVALSANAGISLTFGGKRIWIDALHKMPAQGPDGYSHVTPDMWDRMRLDSAFTDPDLICFTHYHDDHCSQEMAAQALHAFSKAGLILPGPPSTPGSFPGALILSGHRVVIRSDDLTLRFIRLPHEGAQYRNVSMYGLVISSHDRTILVGSDCETASLRLADLLRDELKGTRIDLAILPFPWLTLRKGRAFLEQNIRPAHLILYHIPFEADDINGYRDAVHRSADEFLRTHGSDHMDVRLLEDPLQAELVILQKPGTRSMEE